MRILSRRSLVAGLLALGANIRSAAVAQLADGILNTESVSPNSRAPAEKDDTKAIQRAIDGAQQRGGETVHLLPGEYVCGSIFLRSNVALWLDSGATMRMSCDNNDFLPYEKLSYNPHADLNTSDFHQALLIGDDVQNISIFGQGVIEGGRTDSHGPKGIALRRCSHVNVCDISILNCPNRALSMLGCEFVDIGGITIRNCYSDGIDPDCSRHVRISNCDVESRDDSMCLKTSGALGDIQTTEYVTVTNCILRTASIHFKCGTESCGDFRAITVSNCIFEGGMGDRHGNPGLGLYSADGGNLTDVSISNIVMHNVGVPLAILRGNRDRCSLGGPGAINSINISNIIASEARQPSIIAGMPGAPVAGVYLAGFSVTMAKAGSGPMALDAIPEEPKHYPEPVMFGALPAFGLFLRHVTDLTLRDAQLQPAPQELRPALVADDVARLSLLGYEDQCEGKGAHLWFCDVRDALVESTVLWPDRSCRIEGAKTANLTIRGIGSRHTQERMLAISEDVPRGAVHLQ